MPSLRDRVSAAEWDARVTLAAGHRVLARYGVDDMTYNHFSLRVPGEPDHMLIKRKDEMFAEVSASSLLKYRLDGTPAIPADAPLCTGGPMTIHAGLLGRRHDLNAVLHTHTPAAIGVSAHKNGLLPLSQQAMRFYGMMKYHEFKGFEFDPDMTQWLLDDLDGANCMLLRHHGALVCGRSVAECVVNHHWLEQACQAQVAALSAGEGNYVAPDEAACRHAHQQFLASADFLSGGRDWAACVRLVDRLDRTYRD
jgi:ribulose-5-phosphate 4-epimerase/fuculose-1-phosphate aldolase